MLVLRQRNLCFGFLFDWWWWEFPICCCYLTYFLNPFDSFKSCPSMCSIRPALQIPRVHSCLRGPQGIFVDMQCMQLDTSLESYDSIQQQPADHSRPLTYTCPEQRASQPLKVNLFVHCCDAEEDSRCGKCYRSLERWLLGRPKSLECFMSCWVFMTLMFHWGYGGYVFCWRHDEDWMVVYNWHVLAILLTLDKDYFRGKGKCVLAFWSDPIF